MGGNTQKGFTIIEVTLFLALTGLMAVLLLGGWSITLNNQRYRDSIKTTQSFIQQQYNLVYNVENARGDNLICDTDAAVSEVDGDANPSRGQAECVLMGRYLHIKDGTSIDVYPILGRESGAGSVNEGDIQSIERFQATFTTADTGLTDNRLDIPWDATIVQNDDTQASSYAVAIIRAPKSGLVHTFASQPMTDGRIMPAVEELLNTESESRTTKLCLDAGAPLSGSRLGVVIKAGAASQSSVEPIYEDEGDIRCDG